MGYIGEVNNRIIEKNPYYKVGDYIGMSGLEKTYEEVLRGKGHQNQNSRCTQSRTRKFPRRHLWHFEISALTYIAPWISKFRLMPRNYEKQTRQHYSHWTANRRNIGFCFRSVLWPPISWSAEDEVKTILHWNPILKSHYLIAFTGKISSGPIFQSSPSCSCLWYGSDFTQLRALLATRDWSVATITPLQEPLPKELKCPAILIFWRVFQRVVQQRNDISGKIDNKYGLDLWENTCIN